MIEHTKEPWSVGSQGLVQTMDGELLVGGGMDLAKRNARRIVACVNACAGISTETLEAFDRIHSKGMTYLVSLAGESDRLTTQRDQLLEGLRAAMRFIDSHVADPDITSEMADAWMALQKISPRDLIAVIEASK